MRSGVIKLPRAVQKWTPVVNFSGKSYRAVLTHPKQKSITESGLGETPELAIFTAQTRCIQTFNDKAAERRALRYVVSNPGGNE